MKRRGFLSLAGAFTAASTFPAPTIAQGVRELKLVVSFPRASQMERLGKDISDASGGRIR